MRKKQLFLKTVITFIFTIFCLHCYNIVSGAQNVGQPKLQSIKYLIAQEKEQITRIIPETTIQEFKKYFNVGEEKLHIYEDAKLTKEVTTGYVATGMYLTCDGIEEKYQLSVIGDLTHDGKLNQIDLNLLIKHIVKLKSGQLKGIELLSADLSGDRKVDQVDITILIRDIVYHELYIPEIKRPTAPSISIMSGTKGDEGWYQSNVEIKIKAESSNARKTVYKISGTITKEETEIKQEDSIRLTTEGEYKITAYSYSAEGAKSVVTTKNIKIDKTAPTLNILTQKELYNIKVKAQATDSLSGVKDYTYSIGTKDSKGEIKWQEGITKTLNEYTFESLQRNTEYYIKVEARDRAGNKNSKEEKCIITSDSPVTLELMPNSNYWTNTDVVVTAVTDTNYKIQTRIDGTDWSTATKITVKQNKTTVYAKLMDGTNIVEETSLTVTKIDKNKPTIGNINSRSIQAGITVSIDITDDLSGVGKVIWYYKKQSEQNYKTPLLNEYKTINGKEAGQKSQKVERTITGLEAGVTYDIYAEVYDVAGNKATAKTINATVNTDTNEALALNSVSYVSKTTNSITVIANASAKSNERLTYTIYTSQNVNGPYTERGTATGNSGVNVTLTANGLSEYTNYYYYVKVRNTNTTDESNKGANVRTYCSGTGLTCNSAYVEWCISGRSEYCSGGRIYECRPKSVYCNGGSRKWCNGATDMGWCNGGNQWVTCTICGGDGKVSGTTTVTCPTTQTCGKCSGKGEVIGWKSCELCGGDGLRDRGDGVEVLQCTECSGTGKITVGTFSCGVCKGNGKVTCTICNGTGKKTSSGTVACSKCNGKGGWALGKCEHGNEKGHTIWKDCEHGHVLSGHYYDEKPCSHGEYTAHVEIEPCKHNLTYVHEVEERCAHNQLSSHYQYYPCQHNQTAPHSISHPCIHGNTSTHSYCSHGYTSQHD